VIHLVSAAVSYDVPGKGHEIVMLPITLDLPTDRRLAVMGDKRQGKSIFLRILSGAQMPTFGEVISNVRLSPVIKSGALFNSRLSTYENIRFSARMFNLDIDILAKTVSAISGVAAAVGAPHKDESAEDRRTAELALLSILPFDCYLIDEVSVLPEVARHRLFSAAHQQGAGVIFATNSVRLARTYADCAIVIRGKSIHPFSDIEEAIAFHER
jgi:ABC-type polysaccharide/polyol phosphate transport system ATPase subunit